jgi:hypothetical protein
MQSWIYGMSCEPSGPKEPNAKVFHKIILPNSKGHQNVGILAWTNQSIKPKAEQEQNV